MATVAVEERELLKSISWFDGFVVALANPSFLITGLGASVLGLGGWGAVILWTMSVVLGACITTSTPRPRRCSRSSRVA